MNSQELLKQLLDAETKAQRKKRLMILYKAESMNERFMEVDDDKLEEDEEKLCKELEELPDTEIFAIVATDKKNQFKFFCKRHENLWHDSLTNSGFHGEELPSMTSGKVCGTLNQYLGRFFYDRWLEQHETDFLDKACEMNIYPGLVARCNNNLELLAKELAADKSESKIKILEEKIIADVNNINNQYWAPGYTYSYYVFMKLAKLHNIDVKSEEDTTEAQVQNHFWLNALECEMMAARLFSHPLSQKIFQEHLINEKLKTAMSNEGFANFDDAEQRILKYLDIDKDNILYKKIHDEVEEKISKLKI